MTKTRSVTKFPIPRDLASALASDPRAQRLFGALPPSHQREYVKHIDEAKKPQTRQRRIASAVKMVVVRADSTAQ